MLGGLLGVALKDEMDDVYHVIFYAMDKYNIIIDKR